MCIRIFFFRIKDYANFDQLDYRELKTNTLMTFSLQRWVHQEYCIPLDLCINIDKKQPPNAKYFRAINKIEVVECTLRTQQNMEILNLVYEPNHKHTAADFKHEA